MPEKDKPNGEGEELKLRKKPKKKKSWLWALQIFLLTFVLSLSFSVISELLLGNTAPPIAIVLLAILIGINILFDIIGVAVTSCSMEPFLAMASRKMKGAKMAVRILKNAEKVSNICADVIGDICGIVSGALGSAIVVKLLSTGITWDQSLISVLFSAMIAAITVGGKALGKKLAMDNCQSIVYFVAKVLSVFSKK